MPTYTAQTKIRFRYVKGESNLRSHIRWFEHLASGKYFADVRKAYETQANQKAVQQRAKEIVKDIVYVEAGHVHGEGIEPKYERSMALLNSFRGGKSGDDNKGQLHVLSDKDFVGGKITIWNRTGTAANVAGDKGEFSYAAFFEREEFNTFLIDKVANHIRPFFEIAARSLQNLTPPLAMQAYLFGIGKRKPRGSG